MKNNMYTLLCFILYALGLFVFLSLFISRGGLSQQVEELRALKQLISVPIEPVILSVSLIVTILATIAGFLIGKFLLLFLTDDSQVYFSDVLIAKIIIITLNILLILLFSMVSKQLFWFTNSLSLMIVFVIVYIRNKRFMIPSLFLVPFVVDAILTVIKNR